MTAQSFESFKDFILLKNPYFAAGYANAFRDSEANKIFVREGNDFKCVFPNDNTGNYFYLRNESGIKFVPDFKGRVADCGAGRMAFIDTVEVQLVALVDKANEYDLINNLRNTCMMYTGFNAIPTAAIWLREEAVISEMGKVEEESILMALRNLKTMNVVRLTVNVELPHQTTKCIKEICTTC